MKFLEKIIYIIFKENYTEKDINNFHLAQHHKENWIFSLYDYRQRKVKEMIRYLKKNNDFILKKILAKKMSKYIIDFISDQQELYYFIEPIVIPVPISKKRLRERGFNQTKLLAKYFAREINGIYKKNIIQKHTKSKKQALIKNRKERFQNVKGVFSVIKKNKEIIKNKDIIIIDDLATTGATLLEIKKILKKNGARNVIAITIAH